MMQGTKNYIDRAVETSRVWMRGYIDQVDRKALEATNRLQTSLDILSRHVDTAFMATGQRIAELQQYQRDEEKSRKAVKAFFFGDDVTQQMQDQLKKEQPGQVVRYVVQGGGIPGVTAPSPLLSVSRYFAFDFGDRVVNTKTKEFLRGLERRGTAPEVLLQRIRLMTKGIVIPRPDKCPVAKDNHTVVYILCDDGKVRATRSTNLGFIRSHGEVVKMLRGSF